MDKEAPPVFGMLRYKAAIESSSLRPSALRRDRFISPAHPAPGLLPIGISVPSASHGKSLRSAHPIMAPLSDGVLSVTALAITIKKEQAPHPQDFPLSA